MFKYVVWIKIFAHLNFKKKIEFNINTKILVCTTGKVNNI